MYPRVSACISHRSQTSTFSSFHESAYKVPTLYTYPYVYYVYVLPVEHEKYCSGREPCAPVRLIAQPYDGTGRPGSQCGVMPRATSQVRITAREEERRSAQGT